MDSNRRLPLKFLISSSALPSSPVSIANYQCGETSFVMRGDYRSRSCPRSGVCGSVWFRFQASRRLSFQLFRYTSIREPVMKHLFSSSNKKLQSIVLINALILGLSAMVHAESQNLKGESTQKSVITEKKSGKENSTTAQAASSGRDTGMDASLRGIGMPNGGRGIIRGAPALTHLVARRRRKEKVKCGEELRETSAGITPRAPLRRPIRGRSRVTPRGVSPGVLAAASR